MDDQQEVDPLDYSNQYNTPLSADEEAEFQKWAAVQKEKTGRDVLRDIYDYDIRGFWKSGGYFNKRGHATDQFKKPNHVTFSTESQYSTDEIPGGIWGKGIFQPSDHMIELHGRDKLMHYFKNHEPDTQLVLP